MCKASPTWQGDAAELRKNVFAALDLAGLDNAGNIALIAHATQAERHAALRITTKTRTIWNDACRFGSALSGRGSDMLADKEIEPPMYDHRLETFEGASSERGYDFRFA